MANRSRRFLPILSVLATALYLALAFWHSRALLFQINPDGVAYFRIAQYYARGDFSLALSSYWGPMLSWLLVPAVWIGIPLGVATKILLVVFGWLFALAARALGRRLAGAAAGTATYVAVLFFALPMGAFGVTPDRLIAFFITWYLVVSAPLLREATPRRAFAAGLVGGLAYLAKSYGLPFVLAHLVLTFSLRGFLVWRGGASGKTAQPFASALVGFLVIALPWVLVLSIHDGRPTFGSAGRFIRSWDSEFERQERGLPVYLLQRPREGRIAGWENPLELKGEWPIPKASNALGALKREVKNVIRGLRKTVLYTSNLDAFSVVLIGAFLAVWILAANWRRFPGDGAYTLRVWLILSIGLYMGGYIIAFVRDRYLWPIDGALIALALAAFSRTGAIDDGPEANSSRPLPLFPAFALLLAVSLLLQYVQIAEDLLDPEGRQMEQKWLSERASNMGIEGPVVSNRWSNGLFMAFWNDAPYCGAIAGQNADAVRNELAPLTPRATVIVFDDETLAASLDTAPGFRRVAHGVYAPTGRPVWVFRMTAP